MKPRLKMLKEVLFDYAVYDEFRHNQIHIVDISKEQLGIDIIDGLYFNDRDEEQWPEFMKSIPYMDYYVVNVYAREIRKVGDTVSMAITLYLIEEYDV